MAGAPLRAALAFIRKRARTERGLAPGAVTAVIQGTPAVGQTLTAGRASLHAHDFTYQWKNNGVNIGGATARTYVVQAGDVGDTLTVTVTALNPNGTASATSSGVVATA